VLYRDQKVQNPIRAIAKKSSNFDGENLEFVSSKENPILFLTAVLVSFQQPLYHTRKLSNI
jgi:hypothetical protein